MSDSTPNAVFEINGVRYVPEAAAGPTALPANDRAVFVIDRGFIYAGDWSRSNDQYTLTNAVNLRRYESIGFEGVLADPKSSKATIVAMPYPVIVPVGSVLFLIPVPQDGDGNGYGDGDGDGDGYGYGTVSTATRRR